jgi:hypothetical protein
MAIPVFFLQIFIYQACGTNEIKVQHFRLTFGWNHHHLMKICSNGWKIIISNENGQIGWKFGDKKMSFWKKIAKISLVFTISPSVLLWIIASKWTFKWIRAWHPVLNFSPWIYCFFSLLWISQHWNTADYMEKLELEWQKLLW